MSKNSEKGDVGTCVNKNPRAAAVWRPFPANPKGNLSAALRNTETGLIQVRQFRIQAEQEIS